MAATSYFVRRFLIIYEMGRNSCWRHSTGLSTPINSWRTDMMASGEPWTHFEISRSWRTWWKRATCRGGSAGTAREEWRDDPTNTRRQRGRGRGRVPVVIHVHDGRKQNPRRKVCSDRGVHH